MRPTFLEIGTRTGALVEEKNRAYGSSFATAGPMLRLLYPQGIQPEQMEDALLLARIWDKMMRIATDRDALGENPYQDIIGYGILGVHMHHHRKGDDGPCSSSASTAEGTSLASASASSASSAATDVNNAPTPNASGKSAPPLSANAAAGSTNTSAPTAALAPTATATASSRAAVLALALKLNESGYCAMCANEGIGFELPLGAQSLFLCCDLHRSIFARQIA